MSKMRLCFVTLCLSGILFFPFISIFSQSENNIELVESIPVETMLDNPDIRNTQEVWLEMINSAKSTIDIEQFYITNKKGEALDTVLNAIVAAANRGVKVRIIVDSKMFKTYPEDVSWLETQSPNITKHVIDFGKLAGGIQHAKFFIIDGQEVFLGSQNFDWRALDHIHELGIRFKNTDAIHVYRGIFNADWNWCETDDPAAWKSELFTISKNYHIRDAKYGDWITLMPTISPVKFDHINGYNDIDVINFINSAKSEVNLQFLTYNSNSREGYWPVLDSALINAASRGVKVKMIISDWSIDKSAGESLKKLAAVPNIEIKYSAIPEWSGGYISYARVEHCKYIVADSTTWISSCNAEKSYFYNTRNAGMIVVDNTAFSNRVKEIFYKDWNGPYVHDIKPDGTYSAREHGEK